MNTDLFIIAAGKGSRMGGNIPKALVPITDIPNLTTTLQQIGHKFNNIFIIINELITEQWDQYRRETEKLFPTLIDNTRVYFVPIKSGLGDGHAVMRGLKRATDYSVVSDDIVICWGDVFLPFCQTVDELLSKRYAGNHISGFIPAVRKDNPYVTLLVDEHMSCMSADFSKYGENHPSGFHDQSIFRFDKKVILNALFNLHTCFWKNGRYITPGGELSLLHAFHILHNTERPAQVYETDYPTRSFNTPEEVALIQEEIKQKWLIANQF